MHEFFDKFKEDAAKTFAENAWRFSKEEISKKAEAAQLPEEHRDMLLGFLDYAEAHPDVLAHLWQWYYALYESGEAVFPISRAQHMPRHEAAEKLHRGEMESVLYLAAIDALDAFLQKTGLCESGFDFLETYRKTYRRMANFNLVRDNTYALFRLGYFLYGYSHPFTLSIGRLNYEMVTFKDFCEVYEGEGRRICIALPTGAYGEDGLREEEGFHPPYAKNEKTLTAHTFDSEGRLTKEPITLDLTKYRLLYKPGDMVVTVHIPGGDRLTEEAISASLAAAKKIFSTYFAHMHLKGFVCHSWLLDPQLRTVLGETSNILAFQRRFDVISATEDKNALYEHVFAVPLCPIEELQPQNKFQAGILNMVKSGKKIRAGYGFLKEEDK